MVGITTVILLLLRIHFYSLCHSAFYNFIQYTTSSFTILFATSTCYFIYLFTPSFSPFSLEPFSISPARHSGSCDFIHNCTLKSFNLHFTIPFTAFLAVSLHTLLLLFLYVQYSVPCHWFISSAKHSYMAKSLHKLYISRFYSLGQGLVHEQVTSQTIRFSITDPI